MKKDDKKKRTYTAREADQLSLEELQALAQENEVEAYDSLDRDALIQALETIGVILPN